MTAAATWCSPPIRASTSVTVASSAEATALGLSTTPVYGQSATRTTLQTNYNGLLTQINQLAGDATYNGVNLLNGNNLRSTSTRPVELADDPGRELQLIRLSLSSIAGTGGASFQDNIDAHQHGHDPQRRDQDSAKPDRDVRHQFGRHRNPADIHDEPDQHLQTGAANLVAADQNQASADLLTEQTQQQLEISALSIANQANQSVLKLFG